MHSDINYGYPYGFGQTGTPAMGVGGEAGNWLTNATMPDSAFCGGTANTLWRGLLTGDPAFPCMNWNSVTYKENFQKYSNMVDANNPDLRKFAAKGGRLIIKSNTGDNTVNYRQGIEYYKRMVGIQGQAEVDKFARLYVASGLAHAMFNNVPQFGLTGERIASLVYALDILDHWVAGKKAPRPAQSGGRPRRHRGYCRVTLVRDLCASEAGANAQVVAT